MNMTIKENLGVFKVGNYDYTHLLKVADHDDSIWFMTITTGAEKLNLDVQLNELNCTVNDNPLVPLVRITDVSDLTHYTCATKKKSIYFNNYLTYVDDGLIEDDVLKLNLGATCDPEYTEFSLKSVFSFKTLKGTVYIKKLNDLTQLL